MCGVHGWWCAPMCVAPMCVWESRSQRLKAGMDLPFRTLFWAGSLLLNLRLTVLACPSNQWALGICPSQCVSLLYRHRLPHLVLRGCWEFEHRPSSWTASTLHTKPSPYAVIFLKVTGGLGYSLIMTHSWEVGWRKTSSARAHPWPLAHLTIVFSYLSLQNCTCF